MKLTAPERQIYTAVVAAVTAAIVNKDGQSSGIAHLAHEFGMAAVQEFRIQFSRKR